MAYIKAISYYLPEIVISNEALLQEFPEWSVDKVAAKVGVQRRHLGVRIPIVVYHDCRKIHLPLVGHVIQATHRDKVIDRRSDVCIQYHHR